MWENHREKIRYKFENFMAKGGISIFISLFVLFILCFLVTLLIRGILLLIFPDNDVIGNVFEHMWAIFLMMTDPGNMNLDMGSSGYIRISTIIAGILGVIIFSMLIALITTTVDTMLNELKKGHSKVIEGNQTLILGWNNRVIDIIKELLVANESEEDACIVILAEHGKGEMDDEIKSYIQNTKTTRIITRSGNPSSITKLLRVSADKAKSAIILGTCSEGDEEKEKRISDAKVLKSILALIGCQEGENRINIIPELFFKSNRDLIETFESKKITSIDSWDILGKILVQTSRSSGLASVYHEILSFESSEFYFHKAAFGGKKFYDILYNFSDGVPMGIRKPDGTLVLRPPKETVLSEGEELIIFAEDDSTIHYSPTPVIKSNDLPYVYTKLESRPEKELVLGWHNITSIIIREYANYLPEGSAIDIMINKPASSIVNQIEDLQKEVGNLALDIIDRNPMTLEGLASVEPYSYDNIIILSQSGRNISSERVDSETLFILLLLRKILRDKDIKDRKTKLITQVLNSENQELITQTNVDDFLISDKMISMIFAQLSEEVSMKMVYDDIFGEIGSEIYMKPANLYFTEFPLDVTFADMMGAAYKRDEICIGLRLGKYTNDPGRNFGIKLNPKKDTRFTMESKDYLVVLAEDEF